MAEVTTGMMDIAIARFMGMEGSDDFIKQNYQYHKDWQLLMPVVEKIRKLGFRIEITISVDCSVEIIKLRGDPAKDVLHIISYSSPINAVYTAVYQFITWYNDNQQKQTNGQQDTGTYKG